MQGSAGSVPRQGARIPHASQPKHKNRSNTVINSIATFKMVCIKKKKKSGHRIHLEGSKEASLKKRNWNEIWRSRKEWISPWKARGCRKKELHIQMGPSRPVGNWMLGTGHLGWSAGSGPAGRMRRLGPGPELGKKLPALLLPSSSSRASGSHSQLS